MSQETAAARKRRETLMAHARAAAAPRFDAAGNWIAPETPMRYRERQWHSLFFLAGDPEHVALANTILENNPADGNDFQGYFTALILRLYEDRLTPTARDNLLADLRAIADHSYRHLFRYTENCGLMNAWAQLEAGRRFHEPYRLDKARKFLAAAVHFGHQYGASREYFSVNYIGVTLAAAGAIGSLAAAAEDRETANEIQAHLWRELAAVWHPNLLWTAGPSGRSYTVNSMAGYSGLHLMAWLGFGDATCPSPMALGVFAGHEQCASLADNLPFHQGSCWRAAFPYTVPADAAELSRNKPFPYELTANTHLGSYRDYDLDYEVGEAGTRKLGGWFTRGGSQHGTGHIPALTLNPRGRTHLTSYMTPDYGVGAATQQMTGQSDTLHAVWRRCPEVSHPADIRTLYLRYTTNDALEAFTDPAGYPGNVAEEGRGGAAQSGPLGVAWYAAGDRTTTGIARLATGIMLSEWFAPIDEVILGDTPLTGDGEAADPTWVFLRDGDSYVGLLPLLNSDLASAPVVRVRRIGRFRVVTFANYDGPPRDFRPAALRQVAGGAVLLLGSAAEHGDFAAFRDVCRAATIVDEIYESHRHLEVTCAGRQVELIWDLQTESLLWLRTERGFVTEHRFIHGPAV